MQGRAGYMLMLIVGHAPVGIVGPVGILQRTLHIKFDLWGNVSLLS